MNNALISNRIRSRYLGDPYTKLIQLKRTFRFLKVAQENKARVLILGNKYQDRINLDNFFLKSSNTFTHSPKFNLEIIYSASKHYDLILCLDPILFARHLKNINLPRILVSTIDDLYYHRDIIDAFDYLIPLTHDRTDQDDIPYQVVMQGIDFDISSRDQTADPKAENIFLTGKAWEFVTQQIFEGEAGNAFLAVAGFAAIATLCGKEKRVSNLVKAVQMNTGCNMRIFGHPRYKSHIPPNPLLKYSTKI